MIVRVLNPIRQSNPATGPLGLRRSYPHISPKSPIFIDRHCAEARRMRTVFGLSPASSAVQSWNPGDQTGNGRSQLQTRRPRSPLRPLPDSHVKLHHRRMLTARHTKRPGHERCQSRNIAHCAMKYGAPTGFSHWSMHDSLRCNGQDLIRGCSPHARRTPVAGPARESVRNCALRASPGDCSVLAVLAGMMRGRPMPAG